MVLRVGLIFTESLTMSRLRRCADDSRFAPEAAEVLETRSLLSGAAAAVHNAAQHAAAIAPATSTLTFLGSVQFIEGVNSINVPGTIKFHPALVKVGSHITVHYQSQVVAFNSYKISLSATVASIDTSHGPEAIVTLTNGHGTVANKYTGPGNHQNSQGVLSNLSLFLNPNGSLAALPGDFTITHNSNGNPPGEHGSFALTPS
jgi:hypothetical protein